MSWLWLLLPLAPGLFIVLHTLLGLALMPFYGVEKIRWYKGAVEVVAKCDENGTTRIFGRPGAQTWGLVIFYAREDAWERPSLRVHERVHILQSFLFGAIYPLTYLLSFGVLFIAVLLGAWKNTPPHHFNNMWRAYYRIPWEIWAYAKQHRFEGGEIPDAWGA